MPRTIPTPVVPTFAGVVATPAAPDALGDLLDPGDILIVICGATPTTLTIDVTATESTLVLPDVTVTVAANTTRAIKMPPKRLAGQADETKGIGATGKVAVDYSSIATVTRFVIAA